MYKSEKRFKVVLSIAHKNEVDKLVRNLYFTFRCIHYEESIVIDKPTTRRRRLGIRFTVNNLFHDTNDL